MSSAAQPSFLDRIDRLHLRVRASALLFRFATANREVPAAGVFHTAMVKLLGLVALVRALMPGASVISGFLMAAAVVVLGWVAVAVRAPGTVQ